MAGTHAPADPIVVSGVSAVSPVGHSAAISYTSVRAGLARIGESNDLKMRNAKGKLTPVTCASVTGITDGHRRYLRQYRLAVRAFSDVITHAQLDESLLADTGVFLSFFESGRPGMDERVTTDLVAKICRTLAIADMTPRTRVTQFAHAGVFDALKAATAAIAKGRCSRAIVGAVDGYLDELTLGWLNDTERLKTDDNPKGFVPGEASAFIVLEKLSSITTRGGRAFARLAGLGFGEEPNNLYENRASSGQGLTDVIRSALATSTSESVPSLVMCDLNGERYRANEWGLALSRGFGATPPQSLWHPADVLGDCGAAAGALNLVFATLAVARRNVPEGPVLVWGSSDDGERGAALIAPASATELH